MDLHPAKCQGLLLQSSSTKACNVTGSLLKLGILNAHQDP